MLASFEKAYWRIEPLSAENWLTVITYTEVPFTFGATTRGGGGLDWLYGEAPPEREIWLWQCIKSIMIFPRWIRGGSLPTPHMYTHTIIRNSELNYVPRLRAESEKGNLHYRESVLWNKISSEIINLPSLNVFKTSFHGKDYLIHPESL